MLLNRLMMAVDLFDGFGPLVHMRTPGTVPSCASGEKGEQEQRGGGWQQVRRDYEAVPTDSMTKHNM